MTTFTKEFLSGSINGRPIKVVATATPGTLIHTADATAKDEIWLYANNTGTGDVILTIEFGGVTSPDDLIIVGIPFKEGKVLIVPGEILSGGLIIRAFGDIANDVNITGYINRIT